MANTLTLGPKPQTLHEWMVRPDGLCFFRVPIKTKDTATLAAILLEYPQHRLETRDEWLGVFRA